MFWRKSKAEAAEAAKVEAATAEAARTAAAYAEAERIEAAARLEAERVKMASAEANKTEAIKTEQNAPLTARTAVIDVPKFAPAPPVSQVQPVQQAVQPIQRARQPLQPVPVAVPSAKLEAPAVAPPGATVTRLIQPKNVKSWQSASRALGEVMSVLQHSKRFRSVPLGDLDWMIMPALWVGQYKLGKDARANDLGAPPTAVIFWARVSPAVDQRLTQNPSAPIKLTPEEWMSGDIVWVVEAAGPEATVSEMLRQLSDDIVRGPIKVRTIGPNAKPTTAVITAKPRPPVAQPAP